MTNTVWRLIPFLEASGAVQMAIDRWLLEQHLLGLHPPALRFYTWSPVAISLGYHQHRWPDFWHDLTWQGKPIELVRRPTGGRAVLHQGDLTYAVVASGFSGSRMQVYQTLCEFLIQGWRSLGVELHYGNAGRGYIHNPNCFGIATGADLVCANGAKLIGSAQVCRRQGILQHGSMRLQPDNALFAQVFGDAETSKMERAIYPQREAFIPTVIETLTNAASRCFDVQIETQPLSQAEWQAIVALPTLEVGSSRHNSNSLFD
jgi:lipoate---protein ligase